MSTFNFYLEEYLKRLPTKTPKKKLFIKKGAERIENEQSPTSIPNNPEKKGTVENKTEESTTNGPDRGDNSAEGKHVHSITEEEAFEQLEDYVTSVCNKDSSDYFLIISGDPGIGKSFSVKKVIEHYLGPESKERFYGDKYNTNDPLTWIEGPTKIPARELYTFLYKENNKLILLDDADDLIEISTIINLFKKILNSSKTRKATYGGKPILMKRASKDGEDVYVPNSFDFTGRIIIITNKYFEQIDKALKSRALVMEIDLPYEESLKRVSRLLPFLLKNEKGATMGIKREVLNHLKSIQNIPKLDMRTTEQAIKERLRNPEKWKRLVERSIQLKNRTK